MQLIQEWQPFKDLRQRFANTRRMEQLQLHAPQKITATVANSALRVEMKALEPEHEGATARSLWYKPMAWLGVLRPLSQAESWSAPLWQTFFTTSIGFPVPLITALPNVTCGCRRFALDSFGDHVSTCESHSGALKAHDWAVAQLAPIFRSAGHSVKCQYKVAPSQGQKRGDLEIVGYLRDSTGPRNLVIDLNITHDRHGRSIANPHTNGHLTHPNSLDQPLETAARAKITKHQAAYSNNNSTSFLPGVASTSGRLHCELLRLLFLQAHRETEEYCRLFGVPAQTNQDSFRYKRAAFYSGIKGKVGLIFAKAAALRININTDGSPVAMGRTHITHTSHASHLLSSSLSHHLLPPRSRN